MKTILKAFLCSIFICSLSFGAQLNYQGRLLDSSQDPVTATLNITFKIYSSPVFTGHLWTETQSVVVTDGLFNVILGSVTPIDISVLQGTRYLGVSVAGDPEISPRTEILISPLSEQSNNSDNLNNQPPGYYLDWGNITGIPSGFADGVDDNTVYSAGEGLQLSANQFSIPAGGVSSAMIQNGSVTGTDIANSTITGADIQDGTITTDDIAAGTITGTNIASGSINGTDIESNSISHTDLSNEPGIAYATNNNIEGVGAANFGVITSVTITIPTSGYIQVTGYSNAILYGSTSSAYASLQIDETSGGTATNTSTQYVGMNLFSTALDKYYSMTVSQIYSKAAGTYTFYLEGKRTGSGTVEFYKSTMTAVFFSTQY